MINYKRHLIPKGSSIRKALIRLNELSIDAIVFIVDERDRLIGSLTDGDVRRGLIKGINIEEPVEAIIQSNPKFIRKGERDIDKVIEYRKGNFRILPVVDDSDRIVNIINFRFFKSYLPVDAVIMAGGKGTRLKPMTDNTPKPLLKIADKPIIEHNIDRLISYGIDDFWISLGYLGEQIEEFFKDGTKKNISTQYIWENEPLGTFGAVSKVENFMHDYVLVTNSDILTNLDYEDFFLSFIEAEAHFSVVTIPYDVKIPYAVLETSNNHILSFKEKPTYTYYSNGGIYLMKREVIELVPKDSFYNATDLMDLLIQKGLKVHSYPLRGYWLDIGKPADFKKAQEDIKHINF